MLELFALDFMRRALLVGLVVGIVAPTIGLFFVVRRYSTMADTLAHVSLAGVAASLVAGTAAIPTALLFSVGSVLGIEQMREKKVLPADTIVSLFLFGALAVAVVLLGLASGKNVSVVNYLFGNIITVTRSDLVSIVILGTAAFAITMALWRALFVVSLDEDMAEASGISVRTLNRVLAVLGAATIAISIPLIPHVARVIRSNTLSLREMPFVEAAKAIGMSELRIAVRHVLPNTLAPLIVLATAQLGSAILTEASLSFLGLGIPEPHPSWGRMLSESAAEYARSAPWLVIFPGIAISVAVFGANLLGDAVRDILDPRQRS